MLLLLLFLLLLVLHDDDDVLPSAHVTRASDRMYRQAINTSGGSSMS
jgi:hypothetical protein